MNNDESCNPVVSLGARSSACIELRVRHGTDLSGQADPYHRSVNREIATALATPAVKQRLQELGVEAKASSPEALQTLLASEIVKWGAVIEKAKIEKQ